MYMLCENQSNHQQVSGMTIFFSPIPIPISTLFMYYYYYYYYYYTTVHRSGVQETTEVKESRVFEKRDGKWLCVHVHSS